MESKKYFIIVGYSEIWENICKKFFNNQSSEGISREIKKDKEYTLYFLQAGAKELEENAINEYFQNKINKEDEIIIFAHRFWGKGHPGLTPKTIENLKVQCFPNMEYILFSTADKDSYPCMLLKKIDNNLGNLPQILPSWKKLKEEVGKKNLIKLIHRIAHLFLPLDIDLMGIDEVKGRKTDDGKNAQEIYLEDVLREKDEAYYRQKLAKLQYIVAGEHVIFSQADGKIECGNGEIRECSPVAPQNADNLLSDNKSIYDLILESDKKNVVDSKEWQSLKLLSGLEKIDKNADEKNPTSKIYKPINYTSSPILQFMCLLDCKIQKVKNSKPIKLTDVQEILGFDWKGLISNPEGNPFHSWFCELMQELEKLAKN